MALTQSQYEKIKEELDISKRPVFFFHDDPDGLCSFLLLYRYLKEGTGIIVKSKPSLDEKFVKKVSDYEADKVFILDLAVVEDEFIDEVNVPIIWIDHHEPQKKFKVKLFNPRVENPKDNVPASWLCYNVVKQDMWIAAVGTIGDWVYPDFFKEFKKQYHDLVEIDSKNPGEILFGTTLGKLCKIFSFVLKGDTGDVNKCIKILTRIESPYEILKQETAAGKFIYKRFQHINEDYEALLNDIIEKCKDDKMIVYSYKDSNMSFTGDLANELLHKFPDKIILIAREKSGEMRMSLRSKNVQIAPILKKALVGINGYGGGHEYACGACVKKFNFKQFVENVKKEL